MSCGADDSKPFTTCSVCGFREFLNKQGVCPACWAWERPRPIIPDTKIVHFYVGKDQTTLDPKDNYFFGKERYNPSISGLPATIPPPE